MALPMHFLPLAMIWLIALYLAGRGAADGTLLVSAVAAFFLGIPLFLAAAHGATVRRIRRSLVLQPDGWLLPWLTGRPLVYLLWAMWAYVASFALLFYVGTARPASLVQTALSLPVFALGVWMVQRGLQAQWRPFVARAYTLRVARWMAVVGLLLAGVLYWLLDASTEAAAPSHSLAQWIQLEEARVLGSSPSLLVNAMLTAMATLSGWNLYVSDFAGQHGRGWYLLAVALADIALFFHLALGLSGLALSGSEWRRILVPLTTEDQPPAVTPARIAVTVGAFVFFALFICLPGVAYLEAALQVRPELVEDGRDTRQRVVIEVDRIGDAYYRSGTAARVRELQAQTLAQMDFQAATLLQRSEAAHDQMVRNIDAFLDWYYSLTAEYLRIGALLTGQLEALMEEQLRNYLLRGDAVAELETDLAAQLQAFSELRASLATKTEALLADNRLEPTGAVSVRETLSLAAVLQTPDHRGLLDLQARSIAGGGAALVSGLVAGKIVAKAVGKGSLKMGAKALTKVASSKAVSGISGAGAGAAAGAAVGSVIPGVGTAIGAAVGGVIGGLVVGLGVEYALLTAEEYFARDTFRAELIEAVEASRAELGALLTPAGSAAEVEQPGL